MFCLPLVGIRALCSYVGNQHVEIQSYRHRRSRHAHHAVVGMDAAGLAASAEVVIIAGSALVAVTHHHAIATVTSHTEMLGTRS